jgi:hypothetical protein
MAASGRRDSRLIVTVSLFSTLFGVSGLEHGLFEILQKNSISNSLLISAIGPAQRFWSKGTETAFSLIPNLGVTGYVAVFFSAAVILWSVFGMRKKNAWILLLCLSVAQFLTGGGFAQIFLSVGISIVAYWIGAPLVSWRSRIPERIRTWIAAPWFVLDMVFVVLFVFSIELAVFGFPFGRTQPDLAYRIMTTMSYTMIVVFLLSIISSLSKESLIKIG